jgi:pantoate--beta-alanine ligase
MRRVTTVTELRRVLRPRRKAGALGFVPTMGALHAGHAALIAQARRDCATVVVSIFVNPTQFNDPVDLAAYPRTEDQDALMAADAGADVLFVPTVDEVYRPGHATTLHVGGDALGFEADYRPGHFDGVALVCLGLFNMVGPDHVYFGQKDAQQVAVLQQLVRDLHVHVEISVAPTVRDADGLALSSRNVRLSPDERARALAIPRALEAGLRAHGRGEDVVAAAAAALRGVDVEYVALAPFGGSPTLVIAARVGATRLIDNVPLEQPERAGLARRVAPASSS